jgi:hypothetical protein
MDAKNRYKDRVSSSAGFFMLSLFLQLFFIQALSAQVPEDEVFSHPLNGESRPRFNRICAAMAEHKVVRGQFVQTKNLKRLGRSLVSRGTFAADAELGMIWDTRSPFPSVMAVGRDFIVQSSGGRSTRLDAGGNETFLRISETMSAVFTGNAEKLLTGFDLYFTEKNGAWILGLIPRDSSIRAFAGAFIMRGDSAIRELTLYEQNGDSIVYELSGHSYPAALSAAERAYFSTR